MSILDRHLMKGFFKAYFYSNLVFVVIFLVVNLVSQMDIFIKYQATALQIIRYFLYQVPYIYVQSAPFATLLAALFTLGGMSQRNEITVLKASGISLLRIALPVWLATFTLSWGTIFVNEYIVPQTNMQSRRIMTYELADKQFSPFGSRSNITYRSETGLIYYVDYFIAEQDTLQQVTILTMDDKGLLAKRIDAQKAVYEKGEWNFYQGVERLFTEGKLVKNLVFSQKIISLKETPADFKERQKLANEMTYRELKRSVEKLKAAGGDFQQDLVYLYFTISFPFAAFFMSYLAVPFTLFRQRTNPILNFTACLVIAFIYWICVALSHTFGVSGILPPLVSAWSANVIFSLLGTIFYYLAPS